MDRIIKISIKFEKYTTLAMECKNLLMQKGFYGQLSFDQIISRMISEVGELINAYKKGYTKEEQSEELADIVI